MEKISSAALMTQAYGMFESNRVFDFIESLDVDSNTAWKILDFFKDYSEMMIMQKANALKPDYLEIDGLAHEIIKCCQQGMKYNERK